MKSGTLQTKFKEYSYARKLDLITSNERDFFHTLRRAVNIEHYYIFVQIHLSALFKHQVRGQDWQKALSKIDRKSVDYVICTFKRLNPVCGIELDDLSHNQPDRIKRDQFVNGLFQRAGLPLLRIKQSDKNNLESLREKLGQIEIPQNFSFY
ncbi:MAG: DUF2726 domain-containing protein [Candidatus Saccharibacteria bacterium]|nr:DUF2726 domain-containing protein [Candidatus Saccharibacteria bacterium]